jgi:hypothetical protein
MFNKKVVFIIGAGASVDYGMPLGGRLAETIAADVGFEFDRLSVLKKGDVELYQGLRSRFSAEKARSYLAAGPSLAAAISSSASVDDALYLLSEYPEAVELGKICIIRSILRAEHNSTLKLSRETGRLGPDAGKDGWIEQMFSMAIANCKLSKLENAFLNITFINFNYDRCLEHYLYWSLQRIGVPEKDANGIVASLSIIRPYGTLGSILPSMPDLLSFGNPNPFGGFGVQNRIRTFIESEALHDPDHVRRVLSEASLHIFIGFGFHRQNMELLSVLQDMPFHNRSEVLATVYKVHDANLARLTISLQNTLRVHPERMELLPMTAGQMLKELRLKILMLAG